jgi:hypothetical protein
MKHTLRLFRAILIITLICIGSASRASADVVTNYIQYFPAVDGSLALQVSLYDTVSSHDYSGALTIFDKHGNKFFDEYRLGGFTNYIIAHFTGKHLLQSTYEGVPANHGKYILYKVTGKGLSKVNEKVVEHALHGRIYKSFIGIDQVYLSSYGFTAFNKSLKKQLYSLPLSSFHLLVISGKGIIQAHMINASGSTVKYYKRGRQFAEHSVSAPAEGYLVFMTDTKGGLLHWNTIGTLPFTTNLPMTYVTAKNIIQAENIILEGAEKDWRTFYWNGKYLYVLNYHTNSLAAYKITKTAVKMGEYADPNMTPMVIDGSRVFVLVHDAGDVGYMEFDKNLRKIKWTEPSAPGSLAYMSKGVFMRKHEVDNGSTGYDTTITIFRKNKIIATHTFTQPYPPF